MQPLKKQHIAYYIVIYLTKTEPKVGNIVREKLNVTFASIRIKRLSPGSF